MRHGSVADEIVQLADELNASHIVMGRPGGEEEENVFTEARMQEFRDRIEAESGAKVIVAQGEVS